MEETRAIEIEQLYVFCYSVNDLACEGEQPSNSKLLHKPASRFPVGIPQEQTFFKQSSIDLSRIRKR
jgi:hypothetical protein